MILGEKSLCEKSVWSYQVYSKVCCAAIGTVTGTDAGVGSGTGTCIGIGTITVTGTGAGMYVNVINKYEVPVARLLSMYIISE